jgi:hypothetical protein
MAYIESCCIERKLPPMLKQGGACFFQTNGDITLQKLMDATVPMVGSRHTLVLTVAELDAGIIRTLEQYLRREWTAALMLLTRTPQTSLIETELQPYLDRIHYACDPLIIDGQLAVLGTGSWEEQSEAQVPVPMTALIIQGAILGQPDFSLSLYSAWLGNDPTTIKSAIDPIIAKLKTKPILSADTHPAIARILAREL